MGLIPGGIVIQGDRTAAAAGEAKGLVVRNRAVLILLALNPHLAALLSAMLPRTAAIPDASSTFRQARVLQSTKLWSIGDDQVTLGRHFRIVNAWE